MNHTKNNFGYLGYFTRRESSFVRAAVMLLVLLGSGSLQAAEPGLDRVSLKSGGELRGFVTVQKDENNGRTYVIIKTASGAILRLDRAKLVRKVRLAEVAAVEYAQQRNAIDAAEFNPAKQRDLMQWCQNQPSGSRVFEKEIEYHARLVLEHEPNDANARRVLGYRRGDDEQWYLEKQFYAEHGYVKNGTSWTPQMAVRAEGRDDNRTRAIGERKERLARWTRAVKRRDVDSDVMKQELFSICDALAIGLIDKAARKESDPAMRSMYLEAIGRVEGPSAMRVLVYFAIQDGDPAIRERALTLLGQPHYDPLQASRALTEFFASKDNGIIQRAAFAIGELGGTNVIRELMTQLVTRHKMANPEALAAGRINTNFRDDGGSGLQTGGGPQTIVRTIQNRSVLNALKRLTDQDFGFNGPMWQDWFIKSHTHHDIQVRKD